MSWIVRRIKVIMLISGIFTLGMLYAFFAPFAALRTLFGDSLGGALEGPVANMVVRNWGALIALVGAMIIYGAFHPPLRRFILTTTALSKVALHLARHRRRQPVPRPPDRRRRARRRRGRAAVRGLPGDRAALRGRLTRGSAEPPVGGLGTRHPEWMTTLE